MRIIICGTLLPPEVEQLLPGASPAAGKYLRNMSSALEELGNEVVAISYVAIPGAKEAFLKLGLNDENQTYKDKTIIESIIGYQKKLLNMLRPDDVVVFYNVSYYELGLVRRIKRKGNKSLLILADHTDSFKENGGLIRGVLAKIIACDFKKFDYGIALSEYAKRLFSRKASVMVMEGGVDLSRFKGFVPKKKTEITKCMYAGTLSDVTGVDILLDAIEMWEDNNAEFYISGKGIYEERVKIAAEKDKRIKFAGFIADDEYYNLLNEMDVFINPRNMNMSQNRNNFPSKVLEYLATGRVVISTKFPWWTKFQDNFFFYENGVADLVNSLKVVQDLRQDYYDSIFVKNRELAHEYGWNIQAERMTELIGDTV